MKILSYVQKFSKKHNNGSYYGDRFYHQHLLALDYVGQIR